MNLFNVLLIFGFFVLVFVFIYFIIRFISISNQNKGLSDKKENKEQYAQNEEKFQLQWNAEREVLIGERKKAEEKNKKLWAMSETVHKERKLVDDANEKLNIEKTRLEADKKKLDEKVKKLWQTSTAIHKEKERINELKLEIEHKHQEILDSVNYAKRIQRALLPSIKLLNENLPEHFLFFQPKDIVSGDFYWAGKLVDNVFSMVIADSTGHGVPGAIMSILNISCLNEAIGAQKLTSPNEILNYTRSRIMEHMANDGSEEGGKDGMDAIICNFNFKTNKLQFSAANNPLWLIRNNELIEFKPDKMPVGKAMGEIKPFTLNEIDLLKDDFVLMITDGFADQFGGPKGKKFMYKPLKEIILSVNNAELSDIKKHLKQTFESWRGTSEQVDDVLIFGVRIK